MERVGSGPFIYNARAKTLCTRAALENYGLESQPNLFVGRLIFKFLLIAPDCVQLLPLENDEGMFRFVWLGYAVPDQTVASFRQQDLLGILLQYCHYVAGLVGIGLSKLFVAAGLEDTTIGEDERLANSMGLFLQKTNIIRDYYGDIPQRRYFWPREAWSKYADKLPQLADGNHDQGAVACLNELVTNALGHLPDVMLYLSRLRNQSVFNFCAIPQMMAIATLERCYNNPDVFHKNVKIRKGEAVLLMSEATNMNMVKAFMFHYAHQINNKISPNDSDAERTRLCLTQGLKSTFYPCSRITTFTGDLLCVAVVSLVLWKYGNIVRSLQKGRL